MKNILFGLAISLLGLTMGRCLIPDYTKKRVEIERQQREIAGGKLPLVKVGIVSPDSAWKLPLWIALPDTEQFYCRCIDWSPDSRNLAIEMMPRDMFSRDIIIADAETGEVEPLWQETDDKWIPRNSAQVRFGPDGSDIIFGSEMSGWFHLFSMPVQGEAKGIVRALTSGEWEVSSGSWSGGIDWIISEDRRRILFASSEEGTRERHLYRIDLPGGEKRRISAERGWIQAFEASKDGSVAALIYGDMETPFDLYLCRTNSEKPLKRLTVSQPEAFFSCDWEKPQTIIIPTSDGKHFPAKLWLPDEKTLPAPLIVYVHGAGYHQNVGNAPWGYEDRFHRLLIQKGFAVIDPDYRGSAGYGRDWRVDIYRHTGGRDLDDVVDAARYCINHGWGKAESVGIWGWSYGGFMTNMAMFKRPDIFKVGCSVAAVEEHLQ